ncbi:TerD family protein [Streptomyces sp. NPDC017254]|uniref:TerD family protein n=1 Tax=unclassified Streptomyces TaxID=2593676 RepID=UPI0037AB526D
MTQIIKGGNLPLSGEPMRVAVVRRSGGAGAPEVGAAALLVDGGGKVRGRGDLVFYNQPEHAGSGVRLAGHAQGEGGVVADWLEIDPGRVEPSVERIMVAASCDGGTFGRRAASGSGPAAASRLRARGRVPPGPAVGVRTGAARHGPCGRPRPGSPGTRGSPASPGSSDRSRG